MSTTASAIAQKVWNYAHVLRDDGLGFMEYTEQITYLLFLKLASEQQEAESSCKIPARYNWQKLHAVSDNRDLEKQYQNALRALSRKPGLLGLIFAKPQSKINDPAKLRHLINMIDEEHWSSLDVDVKGEVYESLLARNSEDVRGGAGQYFTPRPVIRAIIAVMRPLPGMVISDPASGTGGFLLAAYERLKRLVKTRREEQFLRTQALRGADIVTNVARLCAMNLYLHGIGTDPDRPPIEIVDSLARAPREPVDLVMTNPPFGRKSIITVVSDGRDVDKDEITYARKDFWATTNNKQLNFVQHVYSMLKDAGRAAMVVPDNVLFEAGAGEVIRRELLKRADVHTLLRLPVGIWYSTGVKANVLFFDKKRSRRHELWIYDLRTNMNFTLRQNPLTSDHLKDFIERYCADNRAARKESERFKCHSHADILASEKANLDLVWLSDLSYGDVENLPTHEVLAAEVIALLKEAVSEFEASVAPTGTSMKKRMVPKPRPKKNR
jgi:type I restriction enzyme M protein